jgi:hypothetical protein
MQGAKHGYGVAAYFFFFYFFFLEIGLGESFLATADRPV